MWKLSKLEQVGNVSQRPITSKNVKGNGMNGRRERFKPDDCVHMTDDKSILLCIHPMYAIIRSYHMITVTVTVIARQVDISRRYVCVTPVNLLSLQLRESGGKKARNYRIVRPLVEYTRQTRHRNQLQISIATTHPTNSAGWNSLKQ